MSVRPIYIADCDQDKFVSSKDIEFQWHPGFSVSQKQKSIKSFHESAYREYNFSNILEISTKSENKFGTQLSAFNLKINFLIF